MWVVLVLAQFVEVPLLGRGGVPGSGVGAVVANVTAVNPCGGGVCDGVSVWVAA